VSAGTVAKGVGLAATVTAVAAASGADVMDPGEDVCADAPREPLTPRRRMVSKGLSTVI